MPVLTNSRGTRINIYGFLILGLTKPTRIKSRQHYTLGITYLEEERTVQHFRVKNHSNCYQISEGIYAN